MPPHSPDSITLGAVLARARGAIRRHFGALGSIALVGVLSVLLLNRGLSAVVGDEVGDGGDRDALVGLFRTLATSWVVAASAAVVLRRPVASALVYGTLAYASFVILFLLGFAAFIVPGVLVAARRSPMAAVAVAEGLGPSAAWRRAGEISGGRAGVTFGVVMIGFALRGTINVLWPRTGEASHALGGGESIWLALASVHQLLNVSTMVLDGALGAALYEEVCAATVIDAGALAKTFE